MSEGVGGITNEEVTDGDLEGGKAAEWEGEKVGWTDTFGVSEVDVVDEGDDETLIETVDEAVGEAVLEEVDDDEIMIETLAEAGVDDVTETDVEINGEGDIWFEGVGEDE